MQVYAVCGGNQTDVIFKDRDDAEDLLGDRQDADPDDFGCWRIEEREMSEETYRRLPPAIEA